YQDQERGATQVSDLVGFDQWASNFFLTDFVFTDNVFTFDRVEDYEEYAIFGELTWNITDKIQATGGLRYFENESTTTTSVRAGLYTFFNGEAETTFSADDEDLLFRANVAFDVGDDDLLYFTVSEGYRRGGSNGVPTIGQFANNPEWLVFDSDKVLNYELGMKGLIAGIRYDLSAFYVDWDDAQFNTSTPNGFFFAVANAQEARTQGIEAQFSGDLLDGAINYDFGYTFVDAELTEDFVAPPGFGLTEGTLVASDGSPLPGVPEHTVNIAAGHTKTLSNGWALISRVDGYWQSSTQNVLDEGVLNADEFDGFSIVDFTFTLAMENTAASFFIKNAFDERGTTGAFTPNAFGPVPAADFYGSNAREFIALPRTFGIALAYSF
ncbi:MAG: TonB-dependent receptor, partial [Pseudomonadota bacterium]